MSYTYLEILNLALREVNEVPLTAASFTATRGLQQFAKESVNRAYFDISNQSTKWPWLQIPRGNTPETVHREIVQGQQWYDINQGGLALEADWNTFLLVDTDNTLPTPIAPSIVENLQEITYDTWIAKYRTYDYLEANQKQPKFVITRPSGKFGFSPVPDKSYWIEYNVVNTAVRFTLATEVIPFPEEFSTVLVARIKYYLWLFRENIEQANFSLGEYKDGIATMKRILLSNKEETMRAI